MKKFKFLSVCFVVCALAAAFAIVPGAFAEDASADAPVAVTLNGALAEDLSFSKDEKVTLDAQTDLEGRIRWQYLADEAENLWVSVYGENSVSFTLTYAKVFNMLNDENTAQIRCAVGEVFSDPVTVTLKEQSAPIAKAMSASPFALTRAAEEEGTGTDEGTTEGKVLYTFSVDYVDENGDPLAESFESPDIEENTVVHLSVTSPYVEGMVPTQTITEYVYQMTGDEYEQVVYKEGTPTPEGSATDNYSFVVKYLKYGTNEPVANPHEGEFSLKHIYDQVVKSPEVTGYLPYVQTVGRDYNSEGADGYSDGWVLAKNIRLIYNSNVSRRIELTVYYMPADVNYKVSYFKQNLNNDEYTKADEVTLIGKTESSIDTAKINEVTYEGFTRLLYDSSAKIAADGSTEVEVYFDRNYYLMMFDLDGGYGVEPTYAPYETPLTYAEPAKDGYAFVGWDDLATTDTVENIATRDLPATMPAGGGSYRAVWREASSYFTVAYWLEDPDVTDKYNYWGSYQIGITEEGEKDGNVTTGSVVDGANYQNYPSDVATKYGFKADEMRYSAYHHADSGVKIKGDGSSVVNVYYNRKAYTMKFYYAISSGSGENIKYYVVGGTTYFFAKNSVASARSSEIALLDQYMKSHRNICGEVSEPTLNTEGLSRNYGTGVDNSTVNGTDYQYHYITFKAKYGADITGLWPCNVFNSVQRKVPNTHGEWSGTTAFVSAWNGEYNVYYSLHHSGKDDTPEGNQTIKGNYCKLDYQLLWENGDPDDMTVAYLCFWENGANVSWSIPELYRYNAYVPLLKGQTTDKPTKTVDGVTYYLRNTYDTCDNSTVKEQTPPGLIGFTFIPVTNNAFENVPWSSDEIKAAGFEGVYNEAYDVNFYYTRNEYTLTFNNMGDVLADKTAVVPYETSLENFDFVPTYPSRIEENAYHFDGWYTSETFKEGTEFDFDSATMPANNVVLYAKWAPNEYTVQFYLDEEAMNAGTKLEGYDDITVTHGSKVSETVPDPTNGNYNFVAWFYQDANGVEKAFDFDMMPVRQNMKVYGKWKADAIKPYWVYYRAAGTDIAEPELYVADMTTGSGLVGTLKTFQAKGADELYEAYREGWFPTEQSHSFTLSLDGENTYVFDYVEVDKVPYIVRYLEAGTNAVLKEAKTVSDNRKAAVTENFEPIAGYVPDAYQKRLILTANAEETGNNVITFYYTADTTHAYYKIGHYTENLKASESDETTWDEYASTQTMGDINTTYPTDGKTDGSTLKLDIPGFTFDPNVAGSVLSGKLTASGLELKLYYTRNEYPYEIRHQNRATGANLKTPQTGTMKYQATLTASSETFFGYTLDTLVSDPTQSKIIQIENGSAASKNVITFYYTENQATYTYTVVGPAGCGTVSKNSETVNVLSGNAVGSDATANPGYRFVGWYDNADCTGTPVSNVASYTPQKTTDDEGHNYYTGGQYYAKFEPDVAPLTITKAAGADTTIGSDETFVFHIVGTDAYTNGIDLTVTIKGAPNSIVINDLPVGTYTVTEVTAWSSRYTPDGNNPREVQLVAPANITEALENTVTFTNTMNKKQWLDGNGYTENVFTTVTAAPEAGN